MSCSMKISVMAALFLTFLVCLAIAARARTLSSENYLHNKISMIIDYERPDPSITSSKLSPSEGQLQTGSPCAAGNPFSSSRSFLTTENGYGKAKISPPPSPASSRSPTQSENISSPCVAGNPCSGSFIAMETDFERKKPSTPPHPTSSKSPTPSEIDSPCVACSSRPSVDMKTCKEKKNRSSPPPPSSSDSPIQTEKMDLACVIGKAKLSSPASTALSRSPTHSESIASPCVAGNRCSSSFIAMETDYGRKKHSTPPAPTSSKSPTDSEIDSACVACSCSRLSVGMKTDNGKENLSTPPPPTSSKSPIPKVGKAKLFLPPPAPTSPKSPTQYEIDSPSVDGPGNPCSSFILMVTDQDYGRTKRSPPPSPRSSPLPHYDLASTVEQLNHFLRLFI